MQATASYTSNIYVFNNHLWQARIQLDMQYLHIKIHIVFNILKASENIYIYVYTVYTHMYIDVYTVCNILTNIYIKSGFHLFQSQVTQVLKH